MEQSKPQPNCEDCTMRVLDLRWQAPTRTTSPHMRHAWELKPKLRRCRTSWPYRGTRPRPK
eukprot:2052744-Amphidinium_carterae.1